MCSKQNDVVSACLLRFIRVDVTTCISCLTSNLVAVLCQNSNMHSSNTENTLCDYVKKKKKIKK